jgi:hypothetical protein
MDLSAFSLFSLSSFAAASPASTPCRNELNAKQCRNGYWTSFNAFFCDYVAPDSVENIYAESQRKTLKSTMMYLENAGPHNSRKSTIFSGLIRQRGFIRQRVTGEAF